MGNRVEHVARTEQPPSQRAASGIPMDSFASTVPRAALAQGSKYPDNPTKPPAKTSRKRRTPMDKDTEGFERPKKRPAKHTENANKDTKDAEDTEDTDKDYSEGTKKKSTTKDTKYAEHVDAVNAEEAKNADSTDDTKDADMDTGNAEDDITEASQDFYYS